ncbi:MAG TPA: hypothetical protein VLK85_29360, partial [Ramlibacter sp.]|nr:hypothetical protein [Ramlibacter sp.]
GVEGAGEEGPGPEDARPVAGPQGMSPPGRPKGEYRSAQHGGYPVSAARPYQGAHTAVRSMELVD